jgi:hypothetical protein
MNEARRFALCGAVVLAGALASTGQQWRPPQPRNLQVLDPATAPGDVIATMKGFTRGLGVRCQHCHVYQGADPDDLSAFDFASDEKEPKRTARAMLRMQQAINREHLKDVGDPAAAAKIRVTCYTCHRGEKRPLTERPEPAPSR